MSGLETTIVSLYEHEDMSVEDIASSEDLEVVSIKSVLAQHSSKYRGCAGLGLKEEIRDDELDQYIEAYKMLIHSEELHIKERVLRNLINYKKQVTDGLGANDPKKIAKLMATTGGVNIGALNKILLEIREGKQKLLAPLAPQETIDIEVVNG